MKRKGQRLTILVTVGISLFLIFTPFSPIAAQTWIQQFPTGTPPAPRYFAGNAYDEFNDRLILFSGEVLGIGLPRLTDVWVLSDATGIGDTPSWVELFPVGEPPLGRESGTVLYDATSNRIIVHGGCSAHCSPALGDTWVLTNANGLGGTPTWIQLPSASVARASHSAAYDPSSNRMIIFGGNQAFYGTNRNDVWVLTDANGVGSPTWMQLSPTGTPPPPRESAQVVYDQTTNRMILFGGVQFPNSYTAINFNDVWLLTNANGLGGTPQWIQLSPLGAPPLARSGHSLLYDSSTNRMILFGGYFDARPNPNYYMEFNDVWILTEANGAGGTPQWIELTPAGIPPDARSFHSVGYITASHRMVGAMGRDYRSGVVFFNDVWVLANANGITMKIETVGPGTFWVGLKNSDDQGTRFDVRAALYVNDTLVAEGETLCVTGITRNPSNAKEVTVPFGPGSSNELVSDDVISLKVFTRIGTNPDGSKCPGHNNAVGLRLYYDSPTRTSGFGIENSSDQMRDYFLHSASGTYFLDDASPTGTAKYKDSSGVNYNNGNQWKEIGTWSMTLP